MRSLIRKNDRKPLLVVFIHGWQNNAEPGNGNLQSFNQLLKQLAKRANTADTEVIGVFIGWRGLAIERQWDKTGIGWVARHLSFYSRKFAGPRSRSLCRRKISLSSAPIRMRWGPPRKNSSRGRPAACGNTFNDRCSPRCLPPAVLFHQGFPPRTPTANTSIKSTRDRDGGHQRALGRLPEARTPLRGIGASGEPGAGRDAGRRISGSWADDALLSCAQTRIEARRGDRNGSGVGPFSNRKPRGSGCSHPTKRISRSTHGSFQENARMSKLSHAKLRNTPHPFHPKCQKARTDSFSRHCLTRTGFWS